MKSEGLKYTGKYSLIQIFFWMNFVTILGYASMYLLNCKISNSIIGIIIGCAGITASLMQPLVAGYADQPKALSVKTIAIFDAFISLVIGVLLLLFYGKSAIASGIFFGILIALLQFLLPFINSLGTQMLQQGISMNLGLARGMGSLSYAIVSYLMGIIAAKAGIISVPISIIIGIAALFFSLILYPFNKNKMMTKSPSHSSDHSNLPPTATNPAQFLKKYPKFSLLLIGMICTYISHVILNTYLYQIITYKGGGSKEMGTVMAICAVCELPTLFLFSIYLKKIKCNTWMQICSLFIFLKALFTLLAPTINFFYYVQLLQMFGWAVISIAPIYYVNKVISSEDAIKGQAYMAMTYTFGSVIASFIGGPILDNGGVPALLIFSLISSIIGAIIIKVFT